MECTCFAIGVHAVSTLRFFLVVVARDEIHLAERPLEVRSRRWVKKDLDFVEKRVEMPVQGTGGEHTCIEEVFFQ